MVGLLKSLLRRRQRRLGTSAARAADVRCGYADPVAAPPRPLDRAATLGLVLAAILPAIALVAFPEMVGLLGPLPTAVSLLGALALAPAAVGVVTALQGLEAVRARFRARPDKDHEHAVFRVLGQALLLVYAFGLAALGSPAAAPCLLAAILALALGWSFLLHVLLSPAPSAARRIAAIVIDVAVLAAFLHLGEGETAALYPIYLATAFYAGFRLGIGALLTAAIGGVVGFGAVVATSPFWQSQPGLAAGLIMVLAAMPGAVAMLTRAQARLRDEAAEASEARARFLTVIGRGLRGPVDAMARVLPGAGSSAAGAGLPARALLTQISEVLDLAAIEVGRILATDRAVRFARDRQRHGGAVARRGGAAGSRVGVAGRPASALSPVPLGPAGRPDPQQPRHRRDIGERGRHGSCRDRRGGAF